MDDKEKRFQDEVIEETASRGGTLPDEELPGFKINYNGSDEPSEDDFAAREGDGGGNGAETTADATEAVPTSSMSTENGSVAHGEDENKPVMLENESLGGLNETALKMAPGGLKTDSVSSGRQFAGHVGENADGNVGDSSGNMGKKQGITEAEARAMLVEDNARAKEDLKKANAKGRKTLMVVIILAVVLIIAGVAVSVILGGRGKDKDGNNDKQEGNGGENAAVVEKSEEGEKKPGEEPEELVELSLGDEAVKRAYEPFRVYPGIMGFGFRTFYNRWLEGQNVENMLIGQIAWSASDRIDSADGETPGFYVDAEALHDRFQEAFGYDFTDRTITDYGFCGLIQYAAETNQYFQFTGCGGSGPAYLNHWLYKAKRQGDYLFLYELVEVWTAEFEDAGDGMTGDFIRNKHCHFDQECSSVPLEGEELLDIGSEIVLVGDDYDGRYDSDQSVQAVNFREYVEELDMVKWTFRKNEEGNYVFEGLEKVR